MPEKHLILIHGRATKPPKVAKKRLVKKALLAGLKRVDEKAARAVESGRVKFSLAYYGDINNRLMVAAEPERKRHMIKIGDDWYEPSDSYDADLNRLLKRPTNRHSLKDYRQLLRDEADARFKDDLARIASPVLGFFGLGTRFIKKTLPDLGAYLTSRVVGSDVRYRLQGPIKRALKSGQQVGIIAHSMGCIVSYDVLWKLSRMSEYRDVRDRKVSLWLTLGSPLGEPAVQGTLYDAHEPEDGKYPSNIDRWVNIAARDDFVAHDATVADDFKEMKKRRLVRTLRDLPRVNTFWVGTQGSNPHKLYGYLNHPTVAKVVSEWIGG
jgi:hypothetical protein